ncbi:MAG: hypothetical protein IID28_07410 [Planctomycetes bacterium]|nr:hypothetical protein [Planctomycetota bacterium]
MRTRYALTGLIATVAVLVPFTTSLGGSHTWRVTELFSNSDRTVQFIELGECCGFPDETALLNKPVSSNTNVFILPANLPAGSTANAHILLGTAAYAALPGAPAPDHIISQEFFDLVADQIDYSVWDDLPYGPGDLPTNGKDSLNKDPSTGVLSTGPNSPTNFDGVSGNVDACPWDLDADGVVGIVDFLELLGNWNNPYTIVDFLDLLGSWGGC